MGGRGPGACLAATPPAAFSQATWNRQGLAARVRRVDPPRPPGVLRPEHPSALRGEAFSHDGRLLAAAGDDRTSTIWDGTPLDREPGREAAAPTR
jgi:hypothetical protein